MLYQQLTSDSGGLGEFTRGLRAALKGVDVTPIAGLDLQQSIEAVMRVARFELDRCPSLRAAATSESDPLAAHDLVSVLADETLSLAVWLRQLNAPSWMLARLGAASNFRLHAIASERIDDLNRALYWAVAVVVVQLSALGHTNDRPGADDLARLISLTSRVGAAQQAADVEAWNELLSSYRLFR
jgi:hypothetical protein